MVASNTDLADINEILLGYFIAGKNWSRLGTDAKRQHDEKLKRATSEQYNQQYGRAEVMAKETIRWAKSQGYSGNVSKVWWTARPGSLSEAVSRSVDQKKNPTDILVKFTNGPANGFLGISAKSTGGKTDIGFKNPGIGTVESSLKINLKPIADKATNEAIKRFKLPISSSERKSKIRSNPRIKKLTEELGSNVLSGIRNALFNKLKSMNNKNLMEYILTYWIDSNSELYPPYIKVTGMGKASPYSAKVDDPLKNEKLDAITSKKLDVVKVGNDSVGIKAGTKQILKMRAKYESEKLASSIKFSGDPW